MAQIVRNLHAIYDSSSIAHTQTNMTNFVQFLVRKASESAGLDLDLDLDLDLTKT